jgi:PAT family beta-lactamase induction signal transducer AmpG
MWPMVVAYTLPDVVYIFLSYALPDNLMVINGCVFLEQFGYGFGLTAYMLFLIYYNRGEFRTSHYALSSALMMLSLMLPGLMAGALQESMGYRQFFIFVLLACAVTFGVTALLRRYGEVEEEE